MNFRSMAHQIAFCLMAFSTGIVVLPVTGAVGLALMFAGAVCPVAALIKLIASMLGYDIPISLFDIGNFHPPLAVGFLLALIIGLLLLLAGRYLLKLTNKYLAWIRSLKETMLIKKENNK